MYKSFFPRRQPSLIGTRAKANSVKSWNLFLSKKHTNVHKKWNCALLKLHFISFIRFSFLWKRFLSFFPPTCPALQDPTKRTLFYMSLYVQFQFHYSFYKLLNVFLKLIHRQTFFFSISTLHSICDIITQHQPWHQQR